MDAAEEQLQRTLNNPNDRQGGEGLRKLAILRMEKRNHLQLVKAKRKIKATKLKIRQPRRIKDNHRHAVIKKTFSMVTKTFSKR